MAWPKGRKPMLTPIRKRNRPAAAMAVPRRMSFTSRVGSPSSKTWKSRKSVRAARRPASRCARHRRSAGGSTRRSSLQQAEEEDSDDRPDGGEPEQAEAVGDAAAPGEHGAEAE